MDLILWRHAEARDGFPDASRELTEKGLKQSQKIARWLKPRLPTNTRIVVSPAKRTQQTVQALTFEFETLDQVGTGAMPHAVLTAINWPYDDNTTIVVGHQPTLGKIASFLLYGDDAGLSVRKGSIWWFGCRHRNGQENIVLRAVLTPEVI
ncbi:SixA phosphatase family protein [Nitrosomonas halophila]|uniref:Phosphohistidine phosphatase n=1 Tax=Nitrosomonas halophila TaxID=44576 RepID=A0A1H3KCP7_9PROT|nr:histidine phosphatase family protein [Nitrosomonas halophila]SDY49901.1 phosphohistidine phosphatase [Nitrosomonas halophila]